MLFHLILSVMPMFVCLFWVILLLCDNNRNLPKSYLGFFLSLSVINYFTHAAFFNRQYHLFAFMENVWVFTSLAGYPLYYYYIRLLTRDTRIDWRWSWILLPALALSVFSFIVYFAMSPEELDLFIRRVMYHEPEYNDISYPPSVRLQIFRIFLFKVFFSAQVILSVWFGNRLIVRYNKEVKEFYSNTGDKDLSPVKWILFAFVFASVISLASNVIGKDFFVDKGFLILLPSLTHSLFLFFIGYVGYRQNFTISDFTKDVNNYLLSHTVHTGSPDRNKITKQQLEKLVAEEELYKNPNLRITDIAFILGTNRTYVSRTINEDMQTNFCDWVNGFRIEYIKGIMKNPEYDNLSMLQIAEMAGFSSLSAFYRVFKAKERIAPGKYRER